MSIVFDEIVGTVGASPARTDQGTERPEEEDRAGPSAPDPDRAQRELRILAKRAARLFAD